MLGQQKAMAGRRGPAATEKRHNAFNRADFGPDFTGVAFVASGIGVEGLLEVVDADEDGALPVPVAEKDALAILVDSNNLRETPFIYMLS